MQISVSTSEYYFNKLFYNPPALIEYRISSTLESISYIFSKRYETFKEMNNLSISSFINDKDVYDFGRRVNFLQGCPLLDHRKV